MTQIDFYILQAGAGQSRMDFAIRLTEKLYRDGRRVHLHAGDSAMLNALDSGLWQNRDISFIPHEIADAPLTDCPVTLGTGAFTGAEEVLVNLAENVPEFFSRMERVVEIIDTAAPDVAAGRDRYRYYRDRGYPLKNHSIPSSKQS